MSDEDANYANFLQIDSQMQPSTSTQLPKKKYTYKSYKENRPVDNTPTATTDSLCTTSAPPTLYDVMKVQNEHGNMMRVLLREVKLMRRELKERDNTNSIMVRHVNLKLPSTTADEFKKLENDTKMDKEKELKLVRSGSLNKSNHFIPFLTYFVYF